MAILTVKNTVNHGRTCDIYDAHGAPITRVVYCNTETGNVVRFDDTQYLFSTERLRCMRVKYAAPLIVIWHK